MNAPDSRAEPDTLRVFRNEWNHPVSVSSMREVVAFVDGLTAQLAEERARLNACARAMRDVLPTCEVMHHARADQNHGFDQCPVVKRFTNALEAATTPPTERRP